MKLKSLLPVAILFAGLSLHAQSFSFLGTNVLHYAKQLQPFTTNRAVVVQLGAGLNSAQQPKERDKVIVAAALTIPVSSYVGVGLVGGWTPQQTINGQDVGGFEYGAATLTLGITNDWNLSISGIGIDIGNVRSFVEDGPLHNWKTHATGNFFATGFEKDWIISKYTDAGVGFAIDNDSTRKGVDYIPGVHFQAHGANAIPLNLHAALAHGVYSFRRFIDPHSI